MDEAIIGTIDIASISFWSFVVFFIALVIYLQRENIREGFPLKNEDGRSEPRIGIPLPEPKKFILPHGRGTVLAPDLTDDEPADLPLRKATMGEGFPFEPTAENVLGSGIGPGAFALRADVPELDGHGHPKIVPMRSMESYIVSAGRDPRGLPVHAGDGAIVGRISDLWVDAPEMVLRYYEVTLEPPYGAGKRLIPMGFAIVKWNKVKVRSIFGPHFEGVPQTAAGKQITKMEEERIQSYYGAGTLYASKSRLEPQL